MVKLLSKFTLLVSIQRKSLLSLLFIVVVVDTDSLSLQEDSDNISRYNLIGKIHYPTTPGSNVVGEIVQVGQGVKHFKQGQHVVGKLSLSPLPFSLLKSELTFSKHSLFTAILSHKGLGEYCVADEQLICQLNDKQKSMEEIVVQAFEGARIEGEFLLLLLFSLSWLWADIWKWDIGSIRRFEREMEHEDQQRCQEINKRMGFEGSGICVVYGEGQVSFPLYLIHPLVTDSLLVVCTEVALNSLSIFFATVKLEW